MSVPRYFSLISCVFVVTCSSRSSCAHCQKRFSCSKSSLLLREVSQRVLEFLLRRRQTSTGRRGWQAIEVPQGWFNVVRDPRPPSVRWPNARQPDGVRPSAASPSVRPQFSSVQGRWRQERSKVSPEVVMGNARGNKSSVSKQPLQQ